MQAQDTPTLRVINGGGEGEPPELPWTRCTTACDHPGPIRYVHPSPDVTTTFPSLAEARLMLTLGVGGHLEAQHDASGRFPR